MSYRVEKKLIAGLPKTKLRSANFIVAHDVANDRSTIDNEVSYMSRNWQNAFVTHFVGGGGRVIQIAPVGLVCWGCGSIGNSYAYAQVELCHAKDRATFQRDYAAYCQLLVDLAKQVGIPITLDTGKTTSSKGIKSHNWIRENLGGTSHTDPYAYLKKWGVSKSQFENDLKKAATGTNKTVPEQKGKQGVYAKANLGIKEDTNWKSATVFTIHEGYYAQINWDVRKNGWVQVEFQGKKGWFSAAVDVYWHTKNPNVPHKVMKDVLTRADPKWGGEASFRMKKGETVNVVAIVGSWLKCSKSGQIGYLPNDGKHLKKK